MIGAIVTASPNVIIGGMPLPSFTNYAVGLAFKAVFKGIGKIVKAVRAAKNAARLPEEIIGRAQAPKKFPCRPNPDGVRTIDEAVAIARKHGVHIPDDIHFFSVPKKNLPPNCFAEYLQLGKNHSKVITWDHFYNRLEEIPVRLSNEVLKSDEAIVAVMGHEMHELNSLRTLFEESGGQMTDEGLHNLIRPENPGNLHDQAWTVADELVSKMRKP